MRHTLPTGEANSFASRADPQGRRCLRPHIRRSFGAPAQIPLRLAALTILGVGCGLSSFLPRQAAYLWNNTASAPLGLYRLEDDQLERGVTVAVRIESRLQAQLRHIGASTRHNVLLKRVAGVEGDVVCRDGEIIRLNGTGIAVARHSTSKGAALPVWSGCSMIGPGSAFLLSAHPDSFDSRYFGAVSAQEILGVAHPVVTIAHPRSAGAR